MFFPEGRDELYTVFMVCAPPQAIDKTLVKILAKNLVKNQTKNLVRNLAKISSDKLTEKQVMLKI